MVKKNYVDDSLSPLGELHEALIEHRRTFLRGALAKVYRRDREEEPDGTVYYSPWKSWADSLIGLNRNIKALNREVGSQYRQETYSPETFAQHVLAGFQYDGVKWDRSKDAFAEDELFPEDRYADIIETRWEIGNQEFADALNISASSASDSIDAATTQALKLTSDFDAASFKAMLYAAMWNSSPQWCPGKLRWTYLKDLDSALHTIRTLAVTAGDAHSMLSDFKTDPRHVFVVNAKDWTVSLGERSDCIGENHSFWAMYVLARHHGEIVPRDMLAERSGKPSSTNSINQIMSVLRNEKLKVLRKEVRPAIETVTGEGYRLTYPNGVHIVPPR